MDSWGKWRPQPSMMKSQAPLLPATTGRTTRRSRISVDDTLSEYIRPQQHQEATGTQARTSGRQMKRANGVLDSVRESSAVDRSTTPSQFWLFSLTSLSYQPLGSLLLSY
eukprot:1432151-Amphidinium_carterae.1